MSTSLPATLEVAPGLSRKLSDFVELTKPRIALMALMTVVVGFAAAGGFPNTAILWHTLLGTALIAAGASVFNHILERDTDSRMKRTAQRPIPNGRVAVRDAAIFGTVLAVAGLIYLSTRVNPMTGLAGGLTLGLYSFVYTPAKRFTTLNTIIGAIPGALPPVIGWTAVRGDIGMGAVILFLILFLWQFPHFLAIAWMYREDYGRAGLKMLPVADKNGETTARQVVGYSLVLLPVSVIPSVMGLSGIAYFLAAVVLGLMMLAYSLKFAYQVSNQSARNLMRASLVYLPTLLLLLMLDLNWPG